MSHDALTPALLAQMDGVFFAASGRTFHSDGERAGFRERWLGRYLQGGSDVVLLAFDPEGVVVGYLVAALKDPAEQGRFADIGYFRTDFRDLCRRYPAHLHVNLAPPFRGRGLGARLIASFGAHAADAGAPGMHVVTAMAARSVHFYLRCGFASLGSGHWNGREVVFLGKALGAEHGARTGCARPPVTSG